MEPWILERMAEADNLALQARAAAQAGDHKQERELRRQFDAIYNELEAWAGEAERSLQETIALGEATLADLQKVRQELEALQRE